MIEVPTATDGEASATNGEASTEPVDPKGRVGLADLTVADTPSVEILVLDEIANWILSPENPGQAYTGEHGGAVVTAVLKAVQSATRFRPERMPDETPPIAEMRTRLVAGVHEIGSTPDALSMFVITLMPAVISELERRSGDPVSQFYWLYCYALLVLAGGRAGDLDQSLMPGIIASFDGWNDLMTDGFTLPWRVPVA